MATYYAPDDPHVTNPSQPGYVGPSGGGGDDIAKLNAPGAPIPGGGVQPGPFGPGQAAGGGAYTPSGDIPLYGGGSTVNGMVPPSLTLSPVGHQAPVEHFNVDTTPPYTVYPPGTPAPSEGTQLSSQDLTPAAMAFSAMTMPSMGSTDDNKRRDYGLSENVVPGAGGEDIQALNAKGAAVPGGGVQPGTYGPNGTSGQMGAYGATGQVPAPAKTSNDFIYGGPTVGWIPMASAEARLATAYLGGGTPDQAQIDSAIQSQGYNRMTGDQLAQSMLDAYNTGQRQQLDQRFQQQQDFDNQQATSKQNTAELTTLEALLRDAPAMAPQLVPIINQLLAALGLPQLPPNEAQLLLASLAGSTLGGPAAPAHIAFAPLG